MTRVCVCVCSHVPVSRWRGTIATLPRAHLERHLEHNEKSHTGSRKKKRKIGSYSTHYNKKILYYISTDKKKSGARNFQGLAHDVVFRFLFSSAVTLRASTADTMLGRCRYNRRRIRRLLTILRPHPRFPVPAVGTPSSAAVAVVAVAEVAAAGPAVVVAGAAGSAGPTPRPRPPLRRRGPRAAGPAAREVRAAGPQGRRAPPPRSAAADPRPPRAWWVRPPPAGPAAAVPRPGPPPPPDCPVYHTA